YLRSLRNVMGDRPGTATCLPADARTVVTRRYFEGSGAPPGGSAPDSRQAASPTSNAELSARPRYHVLHDVFDVHRVRRDRPDAVAPDHDAGLRREPVVPRLVRQRYSPEPAVLSEDAQRLPHTLPPLDGSGD